MKKSATLKETLEGIAKERRYGELEQLAGPDALSGFSADEREALALLFIKKGEQELRDGSGSAHESLRRATDIAPDSARAHYRKGLTYALQPHNVAYWALAIRAFRVAVRVKPALVDAWHGWANALIKIGNYHGEAQHLIEADEVFAKGAKAVDKVPLSAEYYWHWGLAWFHIGKLSGEASDFCKAMDRYRQAADRGLSKAAFWNDYGNALVEFGILAGRQELLFDATELYRKALKVSPQHFEAWLNLACGYQYLYEMAGGDALYKLAEESFKHASEIDSEDVTVWLKWGMLMASSGRSRRDVRRLEASLELFRRADACEPHHSLVLARWGEALMWYGAVADRHDLLRGAEERILRSIELSAETPYTWYLYGRCHHELGVYFGDHDYFASAIEKFEYGLSLHPHDPQLLYGRANSQALLGAALGDVELMKQADRCFREASEHGAGTQVFFWNDWGTTLMRLGDIGGECHHLEEAVERFEQAIHLQGGERDITCVDPEILYNYGCALDFLGDFSDDYEQYQRATEILEKVVVLDPDYSHARYNLGLAWLHLGEITTDVEAIRKAVHHFESVSTADPEDEMALNDLGLALITLAQLVDDPSRPDDAQQAMEQAEECLCRAAGLGSVQALYNLACFYSLRGNHGASLHFLEKAQRAGALPPLDDLMNDEWLEGLRGTSDFQTFISHLVEEQ